MAWMGSLSGRGRSIRLWVQGAPTQAVAHATFLAVAASWPSALAETAAAGRRRWLATERHVTMTAERF